MSLQFCPECGHKVSSAAKTCPGCNHNIVSDNRWERTGKTLGVAIPVIVGVAALALAAWEYRSAQVWKRHEFVATEMKAFREDYSVRLALRMLDWTGRYYRLSPTTGDSVYISDSVLQSALRPHQLGGAFKSIEAPVRDHFDALFDWLEFLDAHVDAGLIEVDQLEPYVGYYLRILGDPSGGRKSTELTTMIWKYLECYEYDGVQRLLYRFGYRIDTASVEQCRGGSA